MIETYTTQEAARFLNIRPQTVTRYIERGLIHAEKKGRDYLIAHEEIERFKHMRRNRGRPSAF